MKLHTIASIDGQSEAFIYTDGKSIKIYIADLNITDKSVAVYFFKNIRSELVVIEDMVDNLSWLSEISNYDPKNFEFLGESYLTDGEIKNILHFGFESFDYVERTISLALSKPWLVEGAEKYN